MYSGVCVCLPVLLCICDTVPIAGLEVRQENSEGATTVGVQFSSVCLEPRPRQDVVGVLSCEDPLSVRLKLASIPRVSHFNIPMVFFFI